MGVRQRSYSTPGWRQTYFVSFRDLTQEEREKATGYGYNGESSPVGIGSIDLWVSVDGLPFVLRIDNVYYSPEKTNLFSQSVTTEQGFQIVYNDSTLEYTLSMNGEVAMQIKVHPCKLWIFNAENSFLSKKEQTADRPTPQIMCAGTAADNTYESSGFLTADFTQKACKASGGSIDPNLKGNQKCCNVPDAQQGAFNDSCKGQKAGGNFLFYHPTAQPC
ncbi:Gag-pol Polyprotein [Phytophthora cinnamomi]|uniref:Gag-pol Polyprotein n=1 Tax=Phytophthora cinnamomi TaxID=4785 RepID=UPI00355A9D20|nr:Gag-pol Polyprotein [Phytophthora cinnamomi]